MKFGDTVYVVIDGELREGEYRGIYYNSEYSYGVWMTEKKLGQSPFKMFTFDLAEIFTDIREAKKIEFKAKLRGAHVNT